MVVHMSKELKMKNTKKYYSKFMQNNFDEENLDLISTPFRNIGSHKNQEYTMMETSSSGKVTPSVSSMKKTVKYLLD